MANKLYLSAAAHAADNSTRCPGSCSENTHCRAYMDLVEKRMTEQGVEVKRGFADQTGDAALRNRVAEANAWGADLYYVAHTNAGGGRYSMTMCWKDAASKARAAVIGKHRTGVSSHKVAVRTDLYEIKGTAMPCLYDELFFHDNPEDCARFHSGGMEQMAEETVKALCEILEVPYAAPRTEQPALEAAAPRAGDQVVLNREKLYRSSVGAAAVTRTGTFYLYDGKRINGRYRVTNRKSRVGKQPLGLYVSGWVQM